MAFDPIKPKIESDSDTIRVMVVDDSAIVRGLIKKILQEDPEITIVGSAHNGELALRELKRTPMDVIVLDIEMPVMDGLTALPELMKIDPNVKVLMASTLTEKNAEVSMKALQLGAADYVPKPTNKREITSGSTFREELLMKVKSLGSFRKKQSATPAAPKRRFTSESREKATVSKFRQAGQSKPATKPSGEAPIATPMFLPSGDIVLRKSGVSKPDFIAIGSSTGGPQALFKLLAGLDKTLPVPVVLTQHMPPTFTTILAQHIQRATGWTCHEGQDGEVLKPRVLYLAPGGYHMTIDQKSSDRVIVLNQDAPENFCRPAVDPMLRSLVKVYGPRIITVILTGIGVDGFKGCQSVVAAGGTVVAQDQATIVEWGMPGAVATGGLCSAVLPLEEIGPHVSNFMKKVVRL